MTDSPTVTGAPVHTKGARALNPTVPDGRWLWENEPCRAACPVHTDAGAYVTTIAAGRFRDRVSHRSGAESVPVDLRAGVRGALRNRLPTRHHRRADRHPGVEAIRR